jgi:hypothetical protein
VSSLLSFYIDATIIQSVKTTLSGGKLSVSDMRTFPREELADYLATCREKSCILCYNPADFLHDILHLPSAAIKFHDTLVAAEVGKIHPEIDSFTLFHRTVGETITEGMSYLKISTFSYPAPPLDEIIALFNRHKIIITRLYAAPYPLFRMVADSCADDSTLARIFIAALPGEKLFILSENNEPGFIRKIPSENTMLLPDDVMNLNMTMDYCFQSLRVKPAEAIMLNPGDAALPHGIQAKSFFPPTLAGIPPEIASQYLAPLAAALHYGGSPEDGDILPEEYVTYTRNRKIIATSAMVMLLLTLILGYLTYREWKNVAELRSKIDVVKARLEKSGEELSTYRKLDQQTTTKAHVIAYLNRSNDSSTPETALASLTLAKTEHCTISGVSLRSGEGFVEVSIKGDISSSGYRETQTFFEGAVQQVNRIPGYVVTSSTVDVKQKTFGIEARYSTPGGRQAL